MNKSSRAVLRQFLLSALVLLGFACSHTRANLIYEKTVPLNSGRFVGPVDLELPRQADHSERLFKIVTELVAACSPQLRLLFPDGENQLVGEDSVQWQGLLASRATAMSPTVDAGEQPDELPAAVGDEEGPIEPHPALPESGTWRETIEESWPGQLRFQQERERRCRETKSYSNTYVTGVDQTGQLSVFADVPQELADGKLTVRVYELIDEDAERSKVEADESARRARSQKARANREAASRAKEKRRAERAKPIPPKPAPIVESPDPAIDAGAIWQTGRWVYKPGLGRWAWVGGQWGRPKTTPALRREGNKTPPVAGARWKNGYWAWSSSPGQWQWIPGRWLAPPARVEKKGAPPVPESPWIAGRWVPEGSSFRWIAGRWGRPTPRVENKPKAPIGGARWRAGLWLEVRGKWVWSKGYWERSKRRPPARKTETPSAKPQPDAVWLAGFWRYNASGSGWTWIAGRWELPPGKGYVWVPDPPNPDAGFSISGRWKLRIEVRP